jgi:CubicO group peptidase (beta-lactamase class C family)
MKVGLACLALVAVVLGGSLAATGGDELEDSDDPAALLDDHGADPVTLRAATSPVVAALLDDHGGDPVTRRAAVQPPPRDLDELRASIAAILARERVPGAGIALVEGDRIVWTGGVGVADLSTGRPVTADTLFRVGSITKSVVALAFVRLAEQGRLDLRASVSDLAPELAIGNRWAAEQPITVSHLLEHTAGFDDMHPNEFHGPLAIEAMPLADALARNPRSRVARWYPGSRFSYANPGYTVAAYLLEKITGRSYEDVVTRQVLAPLGMSGAALRLTPEVDARLARGYADGDQPVYRALYHRPAGNLMASPRDIAALVKLGLSRGRVGGAPLISPPGMARIERGETVRLDAGDASYGLGNVGDVTERALIRGHDGGIGGFISSYGYLPGCGVGYVLLLNASRSLSALLEIRHLLIEYLLAGVSVPPPPAPVPVTDAELRRWAGTYHHAAPRHQVFAFLGRMEPGFELFMDGGRPYLRLVPDLGGRVELIPLGGDRFRAPWASGSHIAFGHDASGRRIFVADDAYFAEEPRSRTVLYATASSICTSILATGLLLPVIALFRRRRRSPGIGWPLCAAIAGVAFVPVFIEAFSAIALHERAGPAVGLFLLTLVLAIGSAGSAVQALAWLPRPGPITGKLYRLIFAATACCVTGYLAAYGLIGIRLWSY